MNAAFVGKMTQSTTHLFIAPLPNHSYKKLSGCLMQRTIHISLQLSRKFYSVLYLTEKSTINKFNYITLFMRYFIHSRKLNNKPIDLLDFVNVVQHRNLIEINVNN